MGHDVFKTRNIWIIPFQQWERKSALKITNSLLQYYLHALCVVGCTFDYIEFNFGLCSKFVTDVIHHDCLGRRCVDKQITNLKLRELKVGQRQQEALCITQTFVIYVIFHKHTWRPNNSILWIWCFQCHQPEVSEDTDAIKIVTQKFWEYVNFRWFIQHSAIDF